MPTLQFSVVTAEGTVAESAADSVTLPTKDGEITVLPNHVPLVSVLTPGVITYRKESAEHLVAVSGGFVQVTPGGAQPTTLNVLADTAERADDINLARAEKARKQAEEAMAGRAEREDLAEVQAALQKNLARIRAAELKQQRHRG